MNAHDQLFLLLERISTNLHLVNPIEILYCTLDNYGYSCIDGGDLELLVKRLTHSSYLTLNF